MGDRGQRDDIDTIFIPFGFPADTSLTKLYPNPVATRAVYVASNYETLMLAYNAYLSMGEPVDFLYNGPHPRNQWFPLKLHEGVAYGNENRLYFQDNATIMYPCPTDNLEHVGYQQMQFMNIAPRMHIFAAMGRLKPDKILDWLSFMPVGTVLTGDVPWNTDLKVNTYGFKYQPCVKDGEARIVVSHPNGFVSLEYDYSWLLSQRDIILENKSITWDYKLYGGRCVFYFSVVAQPTFRNLEKITPIEMNVTSYVDVLKRTPFDNVTNNLAASDLYKLGLKGYLRLGYYYVTTGDWSNINVVVPKTLVDYIKLQVVGMPRNDKTFQHMLDVAQRMMVATGHKIDNPSEVIMGAVLIGMFDGLETEVTLMSTIRLHLDNLKRWDYFRSMFDYEEKSSILSFISSVSKRPYVAATTLLTSVTASLFVLYKFRQTINWLKSGATLRGKTMLFVFAILGIYYYHRGRKQPKLNPIVVHNICPKDFVTKEIDYDPTLSIKLNGVEVQNVITSCTRKTAAQLAGFGCLRRLPVYSCQCVSAICLAFKQRMGMRKKRFTPEEIEDYKSILCYVINQSSNTDDPPIDVNTRTFYNKYKIDPMPFQTWVNGFVGPKKDMYVKTYHQLNRGQKIVSVKREMFVKFEPYLKHCELVQYFDPRCIVKFDPTYLVTVGPYYKSLGDYFKHTLLSIHDSMGGFHVLSDVTPRRYAYASGLDALELGEWFNYWTASLWYDAPVPFHRCQQSNPNVGLGQTIGPKIQRYRFVIVECDGNRHDGHMNRQSMSIIRVLSGTAFHQPAQFIKLEQQTLDAKISQRTSEGKFEAFVEGAHCSGHASTSVSNTEATSVNTEKSLRLLKSKVEQISPRCVFQAETHEWQIYASTIVLGDDSCVLALVPDIATDKMVVDAFTEGYAAFGHEAEVVVHRGTDCFKASFCSGYFYPVKLGLRKTFLWAPKIGRVLTRLSWVKDPMVRPEDFMFSVLQAYQRLFPAIPVVCHYFSALKRILLQKHAKEIPLPKDYEHKFNTKVRGILPDVAMWVYYEQFYGLQPNDFQRLGAYLLSHEDFALLDHPLLDVILDHDCPVKKNNPIGSLLDDPVVGKSKASIFERFKSAINNNWLTQWWKNRQDWAFYTHPLYVAMVQNSWQSLVNLPSHVFTASAIDVQGVTTVYKTIVSPRGFGELFNFALTPMWSLLRDLNAGFVPLIMLPPVVLSPLVGYWVGPFAIATSILFAKEGVWYPVLLAPIFEEWLKSKHFLVPAIIAVLEAAPASTNEARLFLLAYKLMIHYYFYSRKDFRESVCSHASYNAFCYWGYDVMFSHVMGFEVQLKDFDVGYFNAINGQTHGKPLEHVVWRLVKSDVGLVKAALPLLITLGVLGVCRLFQAKFVSLNDGLGSVHHPPNLRNHMDTQAARQGLNVTVTDGRVTAAKKGGSYTNKRSKKRRENGTQKEIKKLEKSVAKLGIKPTVGTRKMMPKSLTKEARKIIEAIALPQVSPGIRLSSGFNDAATGCNSLFEKEPIVYGTEPETNIYAFRSALRNTIRGIPLLTNEVTAYAGMVRIRVNGGSNWQPVNPRCLEVNAPIIQAIPTAPAQFTNPHGQFLYPGRLGPSDQRRGFWVNAGDTVYAMQKDATARYYRALMLTGETWTPIATPVSVNSTYGIAQLVAALTPVNSLEGEYIAVEVMDTTPTNAVTSEVMVGVAIFGGVGSLTYKAPVNGDTLGVNPAADFCWGHRPIKDLEKHFAAVDDVKIVGTSILYTQTSAFTSNQGEVAMAQFEGHRPWWANVPYDVISSVNPSRGKYMPVTNGAYAFLKPNSRANFDYIGEFEISPLSDGRRFWDGATGPSGFEDGAFDLYPESDYLALVLAQDPSITRTGSLTVATTIEYLTEDQWAEVRVSSIDPAIAAPAIASIRLLPQFHQNEFHISDVFDWLKDKAAAVVNGVLEYGPMILKGAAMAAPLLL